MESSDVLPEAIWGLLTRIFWVDEISLSQLKSGFDLIPDYLRI